MDDTQRKLFKNKNFLWHLAGVTITLLGDQFTQLALPWLVLRMTGDAFLVGIVLAFGAAPRLIFMFVGGAVVDKHAPKYVLLLGRSVNVPLLGLLSYLVFTGAATVPILCALSAATGLSSAFYYPASRSIVPQLVAPEQLPLANGLLDGARQAWMAIAPLLAGALITVGGDGGLRFSGNANGLGLAFLVDSISFALAAVAVSRIRVDSSMSSGTSKATAGTTEMMLEGLEYSWREPTLKALLLYMASIYLFTNGPVTVALPVLAMRIGGRAEAFGILVTAYGIGTLAGMSLAGFRPAWGTRLGMLVLLGNAVVGCLFVLMGWVTHVSEDVIILAVVGVPVGFLQVYVGSWLQLNVRPSMMGRVMSLFLVVYLGIGPLSGALAGWAMRYVNVTTLFIGAGSSLVLIVLVTSIASPLRQLRFHTRPAMAGGTKDADLSVSPRRT